MNTKTHLTLLSGAAAVALLATAPAAMAFDQTRWEWSVTQTDDSTTTRQATLNALPTGLASIDKMQVYVGNPDAQASADSQVTLPASLDPADAMTDLGTVEVGAAAYGNVNASDSTVALNGSIGQFQVGGIDPTAADPLATDPLTVDATAAASGNTSRLVMETLMNQAATGLITPHQTTASADAVGIKDALVDVEARAVSNSSSLTLTPEPAEALDPATIDPAVGGSYPLLTDALMTADVTQFSLGDVRTTALGSAQTIGDVSNLGALDRPIMRVNATSIGNLSTASVAVGGNLTDPVAP
ncbi:hypothetical protein [Ferrovibrio xuzhouensis]|uniref:Choice-of-anchor G family protein n=1 Tax=Ferrovibrio xuzhouensis TaxID=1576914 RepID=A0ABV7V9C2_9PROT